MCWGVGVFLRVIGNLTCRICRDLFDGAYGMCSICFCCGGTPDLQAQDDDYEDHSGEQFYKCVDREKAEILLADKQDGTFIVRPSLSPTTIGTLSVVQDAKVFHLAIRRRLEDGLVALGTPKPGEKCFKDLNSLINYYVSNYLVLFSDNRATYTLLLPFRH